MSADDRAAALDELAVARDELRHASHVIALIKVQEHDDDPNRPTRLFARRREIELRVAELRLSLWAGEARRLEQRVRAMGIRP